MIDAAILVPEITKGMKSIGSKSLLKVRRSKYIIDQQIEQIYSISKKIRINIVTGFDSERIKKILSQKYSSLNIIHNNEYETTNYGKSLQILLKEIPDDSAGLFILSSGVLFKKQTIHHSSLKNNSKLFLLNKSKTNFDIGCSSNEKTEYLFYDLPETWSECLFLNKKDLDKLKQIIVTKNMNQMYIFEIINFLISHQNVVFEKKYLPKSSFLKINSIKDINKAKVFV